jgi:hypothetical protein
VHGACVRVGVSSVESTVIMASSLSARVEWGCELNTTFRNASAGRCGVRRHRHVRNVVHMMPSVVAVQEKRKVRDSGSGPANEVIGRYMSTQLPLPPARVLIVDDHGLSAEDKDHRAVGVRDIRTCCAAERNRNGSHRQTWLCLHRSI